MRVFTAALVAIAATVSLPDVVHAQQTNVPLSLFGRYLDQLRQQSGIPGLSAVVVQDGNVVWSAGFGMADVERSIAARPDTPYPIGEITQTLGATVLLQKVERGSFDLRDRIGRWTTLIPENGVTVRQVLTHTSRGAFSYEPARFAAITPVVEYYGGLPFRRVLANEILNRLAMYDSVPGHDMEQVPAADQPFFASDEVSRYAAALTRLAAPYRVDSRRRAVRSEYPPRSLTAGSGLISSALDLARFDAALDDDVLLTAGTRAAMWQTPATGSAPTGLGWFVQTYNGERLVWHFGMTPDAFSSLMLKVPERRLTLIILANSDGLSAPFALAQGDVTTSLFARLFLRVFLG